MRYEIVKVLLMDNVGVFMKKSLKVLLLVGLAQSAHGAEQPQARSFAQVIRNVGGATFGGAALATAPVVVRHAYQNSQNFMPLTDGLPENPLFVPALAVGGSIGLGAGLYASRNDIKNVCNTIKDNVNFSVISSNWFSLASSFSLGYTAATFAAPFVLPEGWAKPAALGVGAVCLVKGLHGASTTEELSRKLGAAENQLNQDLLSRNALKDQLEAQDNDYGTLIGAATTMRNVKAQFQQQATQFQNDLRVKTEEFDGLKTQYTVLDEQHTQFKVGIGAFCTQLGKTLKVQEEANSDDTYRAKLLTTTQKIVTQRDDALAQHEEDKARIAEQGVRLDELNVELGDANHRLDDHKQRLEILNQIAKTTGAVTFVSEYVKHSDMIFDAEAEQESQSAKSKTEAFARKMGNLERSRKIITTLEPYKNLEILISSLPALQNTGSHPMITSASPAVSPSTSQLATPKSPVMLAKNGRNSDRK
jgi:hypothetical protein